MSRVPSLDDLAAWLHGQGYLALADLTRQLAEHEKVVERRQSYQWSSRILTGLPGPTRAAVAREFVLAKRLSGIAYDIEPVKLAITNAYSKPGKFTGSGIDLIKELMEDINGRSQVNLGKSLFDFTNMDQVRYLGLWGSPVEDG